MPHFFTRSGEQGLPDAPWIEATLKITEAVCCTGCRHLPSAGSGGSKTCDRGASMIDWHHPRIYERLRCFGLCLFTLGVASHNVDNPPAALAAIVVTMLLIVRLKIELDIKRDEEEHSLSPRALFPRPRW
jgi:hypothetical protein